RLRCGQGAPARVRAPDGPAGTGGSGRPGRAAEQRPQHAPALRAGGVPATGDPGAAGGRRASWPQERAGLLPLRRAGTRARPGRGGAVVTLVRHHRVHDLDVLTLASPANRNALSVALLAELLDRVAASAERDARGLVLDHIGPAFCSGVDIKERMALGPADQTHSALLGKLLRRLWAYPGPVLCRVDGAVRGGGMGLVAAAD